MVCFFAQVEEEERRNIQAIKDAEISKAMNELEDWKKGKNKSIHSDTSDVTNSCNAKNLSQSKSTIMQSENKKEVKKVDEKKDVPPPRSTGNIQLKFTPRAFVTPSRESKAPEEEAWLQKVAEMNKVKADAKTRSEMEDMNPAWLKEKGGNFYKQGNYIAAINAFTAAIVLNGTDPSLYNNRAACHLHMKQFTECIQDATMALNLLDPPVQANAKSRCIAFVRRGTAYFKTEQYVNALGDYNSALKIDPKNESINEDAEKIRQIIQSS